MELHVEDYGSGEPSLVWMHGFGGSARNLRPQARAFRDRHRVVLFDLRGHARSGAPTDPAEYSLGSFVEDVLSVLTKVGETRVVLGGVSMGAAIALEFAMRHREAVLALVLASFPASGHASRWAEDLALAIEQRGLESAGEELVWGGGRFDDEAKRFIRQGFTEHAPAALSSILRNALGRLRSPSSMASELRALSIPTLLIVGEDDAPSVLASRELAALLPRARLVVIPGAGHVVNLQKPEAFNEAIQSLLSEIEEARSGA